MMQEDKYDEYSSKAVTGSFTYFNINLSNKNPKIENKSAFSIKIQISSYSPNNLKISVLTVLKCNYIKNKK